MTGLPGRKRSLTISSAMWIQSTNVTDGRTPGDSKYRAYALLSAVITVYKYHHILCISAGKYGVFEYLSKSHRTNHRRSLWMSSHSVFEMIVLRHCRTFFSFVLSLSRHWSITAVSIMLNSPGAAAHSRRILNK